MKVCDRCETKSGVQQRVLVFCEYGPLTFQEIKRDGFNQDLCNQCRDATLKMLEDWFKPLAKVPGG